MKLRVTLFPAMAAWSLLACSSSPPVRYHTLSTPGITSVALMPPASFSIEVLPVGVPVQWDIPQVVLHTSQDNVILLENDRWLSSLSDEIHTALFLQVAQRLGAQDVFGLTPPARPVVRVRVQIRRFESWPGQAVYLDADWLSKLPKPRKHGCRIKIAAAGSKSDVTMTARDKAIKSYRDTPSGRYHSPCDHGTYS